MKGSIYFRKDTGFFCISWYDSKSNKKSKTEAISWYLGERMWHRKTAEKCLARMQGEVETGVFRLERWKGKQQTDVIDYLRKWLKTISPSLKPGAIKDYGNSIEKHLIPFFRRHPVPLHEIQHDTLLTLLNEIQRSGKGKKNVMYCLRACLDYAWRSNRIDAVPPFPKKKQYGVVEPVPVWIPEARQLAIIEAIPEEHQAIFYWLKYHFRRPGEAQALHKEDFDGECFMVRRTFSAKVLTHTTKTGEVHVTPMMDDFKPHLEKMQWLQRKWGIISPFFFVNPNGKKPGKYYTNKTLNDILSLAQDKLKEPRLSVYPFCRHSSAGQYLNEKGGSLQDLQTVMDHQNIQSTMKYAKMEMARKKELMSLKVTPIRRELAR